MVERTLGHRLFAVTSPDTHAVDNITLLGLVAQTTRFVWTGWTGCPVDNVQLTVLPASVSSRS